MKGTIGIVLIDNSEQGLKHEYFASILEGFRNKCNEEGYNIAFLNSIRGENSKESYLEQAKKENYLGVLIACSEDTEEIEELVNSDLVIGTIDTDYKNVVNVESDNTIGMKALMELIISKGHKRIAIISGDDNYVSSIRFKEYCSACEASGIQINDDYVLRSEFRNINKAAYLTEKLVNLAVPPTCIIYSDDFAAIGGINAIHARGLDIPRDISVAGFDGNEIMSRLEPKLTSVYQDSEKMGKIVAEKMIERIENPEIPRGISEVIDTQLKTGRSVGKIYSF